MKMTILNVANKKLPPNDYRIQFGKHSSRFHVVFALPELPDGMNRNDFIQLGFQEGLGIDDLANFLRLRSILKQMRDRLGLVHFYSTKLVLLGPMIAASVRVPSVVTVTGLGRVFDSPGPASALLQIVYMFLLRISASLSRKVLFQNRGHMAEMTRQLPRHAHKFAYVGSTVDLQPVLQRTYEEPVLRVLLVARLMPAKGIEDFLQVASHAGSGEIQFILVGPPSKGFNALEERVREFDRNGSIVYKGELDSGATALEFRNSHVFYFPSYGEGLARVMLECGFSGLCPIAYDIPANRDLLGPDRGFLLKPGDIAGAADTLRRLAVDRDLLGRNALSYQRFITENYSAAAYESRMDRILGDAIR